MYFRSRSRIALYRRNTVMLLSSPSTDFQFEPLNVCASIRRP